jgi:hypothetical protein
MATTPLATSAAPVIPTHAAAPQAPAENIGPAIQATGTAQALPAPKPQRSRNPRGLIDASGSHPTEGAPALLEIAAGAPFHTDQRRSPNGFVSNAQNMFWVLSCCDSMMGSTDRFLRSSPAWLPIVSQLYISFLWLYHNMRIYLHTTYGFEFANLLRNMTDILHIDECMIPGPLIPFFESIAAVNGPFEWIGDILPLVPPHTTIWHGANFITENQYLRHIPIPAVLLDQLFYFSQWNPPANQTLYGHFQWYRNIFSEPSSGNNNRLRRFMLSPPGAGSLYTTAAQTTAAYTFWNAALQGFNRIDAGALPVLTDISQLLGLNDQNFAGQIHWFQHVSSVMQTYSKFFNGSRPIKSISPVGLGACEIVGTVGNSTVARDWIYPQNMPDPFLSSRFNPPHAIPSDMLTSFSHADHTIEEQAEQYQTLAQTNVFYSDVVTQHGHVQLVANQNILYGDYWLMARHRHADNLNFVNHYMQVISHRYHNSVANKTV